MLFMSFSKHVGGSRHIFCALTSLTLRDSPRPCGAQTNHFNYIETFFADLFAMLNFLCGARMGKWGTILVGGPSAGCLHTMRKDWEHHTKDSIRVNPRAHLNQFAASCVKLKKEIEKRSRGSTGLKVNDM
ncbi:hypothetical protein PMIN06_006927 [Paraphaeosphaeria minitans]